MERHLKYLGRDSWSRYVYEDQDGKLWKLTDCCSPRECCEERGDTFYSSCGNGFDGEPDCPMPKGDTVVLEPSTEPWMVFSHKGVELLSYTLRGTFVGEREETIFQLSRDHGIPKDEIETEIVEREVR